MSQTDININPRVSAEKGVLDNIFHAIDVGSFSHSYMIEGGSSSVRERCALNMALAFVCENKINKSPCRNCSQCKKVLANEHTDIKFLGNSGSGKGDIKVDDVRKIIKEAYVVPAECDFHVFVFKNAERMNKNAQNALLKTLEDPPENTIFILLTPSKELLLPTVVSRTQSHILGQSTTNEIKDAILVQYPALSQKDALRAAKVQQVFDKIEMDERAIKALAPAFNYVTEFFVKKNYRILSEIQKNKDEIILCLSVLAVAARDIVVTKKNENARIFVFEDIQDLQLASNGISMKKAMDLYEAFSHAAERIAFSGNVASVFEELLVATKK